MVTTTVGMVYGVIATPQVWGQLQSTCQELYINNLKDRYAELALSKGLLIHPPTATIPIVACAVPNTVFFCTTLQPDTSLVLFG